MTVQQLIDKLNRFPKGMPVTIRRDMDENAMDDPECIKVNVRTYSRYYDLACSVDDWENSFEYISLE